jgi:hypothetical protein
VSDLSEGALVARDTTKTQIVLAASIWTAVGIGLPSLGFFWMQQAFGVPTALLITVPLVLVGALKAFFILDPLARKTVSRIRDRGPASSVIGFLSGRTWAVVAAMMLTGQILRASPIPRADIGFVYVAVGSALVLASRKMWMELAAA